MSEIEEMLQKFQKEGLGRVYRDYGEDESKWNWFVNAVMRCRANRGEGFLANELSASLKIGSKICPIKGQECIRIRVPHPATNRAGVVLARDYPEACPLCGLKPISSDFDIQ